MTSNRVIYLNVYDLHDANRVLSGIGLGVFHTGVEISGYEYSFSDQGISRTRPRLPEFGNFREQIRMGTVELSQGDINSAMNRLQTEEGFAPGLYHITNRNCNHFSDAFCYELLGLHTPEWVNRAAGVASVAVPQQDASTASSSPAFAAPGVVRSPTLESANLSGMRNESTSDRQSSSSGFTSVFGWMFGSSSNSSDQKARPSSSQQSSSHGMTAKKASTSQTKGKKELTDKQKEMLSKLKNKS
jgi:hypothetical protein